jgi:hypothetical protein
MLNFQYPTWYFFFCALLGAIFAATLYFRNTTFREQSPQLNKILGALRFLSGALIAALLLSPLLKSTVTDIRKPVVVLAQDVSESIGVAVKDTPQYKAQFEQLATRLSEKYDVKTYSFGEKVREGVGFSFKDKLTNASDLMKNVYDLYANQNLGAVVIATDGIYNEGSNPLYAAAKLNAPVYTIALGDTTPKKDLVVKRVFHNNIAYLGDKFNIQIDVAATNCTGGSSILTVAKLDAAGNPSVVSTSPISINKNDFFTTKEVTLDATQAGIMRFRVNLTTVSGEVSTVNNTKEIFIEVLDARTKILLLGNAPHPDIAALSEAVSVNKNYTLTVAYADDLKINPADFDFIVLHNLPSATQPLDAILNNLNAKKIPRLFIVGAQADARKLTSQQSMMALNADGKNVNDVQASLNSGFNLFTLEDSYRQIPNFNPIVAPFGEFKEIGGGQVLFYQKIGKVDTKYPLIMLGESNGIRTGIITAEGLWKWRLFDFAQQKNHDIFDGLMAKICTYLSVKEDKRKFRSATDKNVYRENEPVQFSAEIYNNSYELINEADVRVIVTNGEGKQFPYTMNKSGRAYALNAGILPVGNYTYKSTTSIGGQQLEAGGAFSIQPIQLELYETTADHALLRALSNQLGGSMVSPQNMASLADSILAKNLKPVMYTTQKTENALNLKWIFGILISLLAAEWFLRRYFGGY